MAEEQQLKEKALTPPSETVNRLREVFTPAAAKLRAEDEPAIVYTPGPQTK